MRIGILGAGNVGGTLGRLLARRGHTIAFGVREPGRAAIAELATLTGGRAGPPAGVADAEVIVLAVPWASVPDALAAAGDLSGKILVDATNPLLGGLRGLALGTDRSGGEEVARLAPGARVVKAWNGLGMQTLARVAAGELAASGFLCGDDAAAKQTVGELVGETGLVPVDCGPLSAARMLEPLAFLWIHLAYRVGLGPNIAFFLHRG
jgi:hypothetical protein